jgi:acyl carrier protein
MTLTSRVAALPDAVRLQRWLVVYLAVLTGEDSDSIDADAPLAQFDLDSVDAVEMASQFEKTFACRIGPEFFLQGRQSVRALVPRLLEAVAA